MLTLNHKKLDIYKKSIELVSEIYLLTADFPGHEQYGLTSQLRRAAVSIPSNIAEGSSRRSHKERMRFFQISRSSLVELDTQIELSLKLKYINLKELSKCDRLANDIFAMFSGLIK